MGFKAGETRDMARAGLKRCLVFLAVRGCIPARVAESLIHRWGLIHA
jgi:hypothetical protein